MSLKTYIKATHKCKLNDGPFVEQGRTQNLVWVGSFQEKVDLFDGAGACAKHTQHVKHAKARGVWGHAPPGKFEKIDTKILDLVTFQPLKAPLNVGQKYVYSLHIIATPCI